MKSISKIEIRSKKFCVYLHKINEEIIYVGSGVASRPFSTDGRNEIWSERVSTFGEYSIEIVEWFDEKKSAANLEKSLIKKYKPCCNIVNYKRVPERKGIRGIRVDDKTWNALKRLARRDGVCVSILIRRILRNFVEEKTKD